jgi:hypothetical protein
MPLDILTALYTYCRSINISISVYSPVNAAGHSDGALHIL